MVPKASFSMSAFLGNSRSGSRRGLPLAKEAHFRSRSYRYSCDRAWAAGERKPILQSHAMNQPSQPLNMPESRQLALINQATTALAEAKTLAEIRTVRDRAEAVRHYARSASLSLDLQNQAAEIKLRAERKAGKLLADLALRGGNRKSKSQPESLILADLGINRNQSSRWQQMAAVPETQFQRYLDETKAANDELSSAALRRLARRLGPAKARENAVVHIPRSFAQEELSSAAEIIQEAKNHLRVATRLLEPLCTTGKLELGRAECQHLRRMLSEIGLLLDELHQ